MAIDRTPSPPQGERSDAEQLKQLAAEAAAKLVEDGMRVGLGTGTTVAHLLPALAARMLSGLRCVATSPQTQRIATELGICIVTLEDVDGSLDIAIDGADQIDPDCWLIKGGGAAHTREKIVAAAAERFVVIASGDKRVESLRPPVPVELLHFGISATIAALSPTQLRDVPRSPDGNLIGDYLGAITDPRVLAERLAGTPGVVEHGLFERELVSDVILADESGVTWRKGGKGEAQGTAPPRSP